MTYTPIWANTMLAQAETGCDTAYDLNSEAKVVEAEIQAELDNNELETNPTDVRGAGVGMLKQVAQRWLCRNIRILQKHDGTFPNSLKEGTQSVDIAIDASIKFYDQKGREFLDKYILSHTGTDLDEGNEFAGLIALAGEDL